MSFVDCFNHYAVGQFLGIDLYLPCKGVKISAENETDKITDRHMLLGGGSGEHSMALIDIANAVKYFIVTSQTEIDSKNKELPEDARFPNIYGREFDNKIYPYFDSEMINNSLKFINWTFQEKRDLLESAEKSMTPYCQKEDGIFELWILSNIGQLVFYSMPELMTGDEFTFLDEIKKENVKPLYRNIMIYPKNYPMSFGRKTVDGETVWKNDYWFD